MKALLGRVFAFLGNRIFFMLVVLARGFVPHSAAQEISLFNGKDLAGWEGRPEYWSVEDGAITGTVTPENSKKQYTSLIWKGGQVADFDLRCKFKMTNTTETPKGPFLITFRGWLVKSDYNTVGGYDALISSDHGATGGFHENQFGRLFDVRRGEKAILEDDPDPKKTAKRFVGLVGDANDLKAAMTKDGWNDYRILAVGNHFQLFVNGRQTVDALDQRSKVPQFGLLAFQFFWSTLAKVQFKDIRLTALHGDPTLAQNTSAQTARQPSTLPSPGVAANPPAIPAPTAPASPASPAAPRGKTPEVGGQSGKDFSETEPTGGILVGLDVWKGEYYRALVIGGIRAVYKTDKGLVRGQIHGRGNGDADITLESNGAPITRIEAVDDKQQVIALRVGFTNGQQSPWFGRDIPKNIPLNKMPKNQRTSHLNVSGRGALGIYGGADGMLFRFGLLY